MALRASALASFLGAFLLFLAQPLLARALLPRVGGSPAVWTAVQAFFQAVLLLGYGWAHLVVARAGPRKGPLLHLPLLGLPLVLLWTRGLLPAAGDGPPGDASPLPWTLLTLTIGVGPAALALGSTAPLVQGWLHARDPERDPFPLYAASNAGSLLALLSYPLLLEPLLPLAAQASAFGVGYAVWAILLVGLALTTRRADGRARAPLPEPAPATSARQVGRWMFLAAVPASASLGLTQYLSTDLAPVPLLWVAPLAVYLLTWILAFARRFRSPSAAAAKALPLALVSVAVVIGSRAGEPLVAVVFVHLLGLFALGLACHGRLAEERPPAERLTGYYLALAAGGALGGWFNALLAPLLFSGLAEYPLAIALGALALPAPDPPKTPRERDWARALLVLHPLAVAGVYLLVHALGPPQLALMLAAIVAYLAARRPWRLLLALLALSSAAALVPPLSGARVGLYQRVVQQERTFFGVHRLCRTDDGTTTALMHGTTVHGVERSDRPGEPLAYYHRQGPLGALLGSLEGDGRLLRVGAIGLGAGSMAAYAPPGSRWTFFELDPDVERIARAEFSFLARAGERCQVEVLLGDGRLVLEREVRPGELGILLLDAFSSDAVPVHLLTREAMVLWLSRLAPRGLLLFHVSSRYLDLPPVLAAHARALGLVGRHWRDASEERYGEDEVIESGRQPSDWVVLARSEADLPPAARRWSSLPPAGPGTDWRDDWSNLLAVLGKQE